MFFQIIFFQLLNSIFLISSQSFKSNNGVGDKSCKKNNVSNSSEEIHADKALVFSNGYKEFFKICMAILV